MVEVKNLTKFYGSIKAVDDISLLLKQVKFWDFSDLTVRANPQQ